MRRFRTLTLALVLGFVPVVVPATPAVAAYEWIQSGCRPDVWWYHIPGYNIQYWREGSSFSYRMFENWPTLAFARKHLQVYAEDGYECGWMGPPLGEMQQNGSGWWRQSMEKGALWFAELNRDWIFCPYGDSWCYYT